MIPNKQTRNGKNMLFSRKAFEEGENAICEEILIQENINISSSEEYVDIDSYNEDNLTLNSDDSPDHDNFEEEHEGSKF